VLPLRNLYETHRFRDKWKLELNCRFARQRIASTFSNGGAKIVDLDPRTVPNEFILRLHVTPEPTNGTSFWRSKDRLGVHKAAELAQIQDGIAALFMYNAKFRS
jgi:hypothetical protein